MDLLQEQKYFQLIVEGTKTSRQHGLVSELYPGDYGLEHKSNGSCTKR